MKEKVLGLEEGEIYEASNVGNTHLVQNGNDYIKVPFSKAKVI